MLAGLLAGVLSNSAYAQYFGRNKIQYEQFDWHILKTEHLDIYYYPEMREIAENGAYFAEEAYKELENRFDFSLNHRVPMIFYSSNLHFKQTNITPGFIPDGVGGFFEFLKGRVVIPANGDIHRFRRVIRHELVHVFTFSKLGRVLRDHRQPADRLLPLWFTEGLAEYWSGEPDFQHEMIMRDAMASNFFVPLDDLDRIAGSFVMYKEGEALCRFISEEYAEERLLALIENAWRDVDFVNVMEFVLDEDFEVISDKWGEWLREQYLPELKTADIPSLTAEPIAGRGFNMKPVVHERADGTREVIYISNQTGYTNVYAMEVDNDYQPLGDADILVEGERSEEFEAFHHFESRMDISSNSLLAFVTKRGENDVIHVYDLIDRSRVDLFHFSNLVAVYSPTWSPDGRQIAFTAIDKGGLADLFIYDRDTEQLRRLTRDSYNDRDPDWSPDGQRLVFSSDRTSTGENGAQNLFTYDFTSDEIDYVTFGPHRDMSPRWSPDGSQIVFASARKQEDGQYSAQDLWVVDMGSEQMEPVLAFTQIDSLSAVGKLSAAEPSVVTDSLTSFEQEHDHQPVASTLRPAEDGLVDTSVEGPVQRDSLIGYGRPLRQLTAFTSAAYDPVWTSEDRLVFSTFENFRFTVRQMDVDSLLSAPRTSQISVIPEERPLWTFKRITISDSTDRVRYRRKYALDIAQGGLSTDPVLGGAGGAVISLSDVMGNDIWHISAYSSNTIGRSFLENLSVGVTRIHRGRRADYGYGIYRLAGQRYDRTDPDAEAGFPVYYEQVYGGVGLVNYPISSFSRIELGTSLGWSRKDHFFDDTDLESLLVSNSIAYVTDHTLYGYNGPERGWRGNLALGYTTDVVNSNVSYFSISADVRHYQRISSGVTFASWGLFRFNAGRRARLNLIGGSWSLRGYPMLRLRSRAMWFTSQELRFPLAIAPSAWIPVLAPFGIASIRGAAFIDAAHLWNDGYNDVQFDTGSGFYVGNTLGSAGLGLRVNIFNAMVLRYDIGYRFPEGFDWDERQPFNQFFFGWDF